MLERSGFYIDNDFIEFSKSARNLGVLIDNGLTLSEHLDGVVRSATHHLRKIASIKKYLNVSSLKTLVHNLVISRLDYCNSLYYALPNTQLSRIQMILNRAARLISGCSHIDRITPILIDLHWLPVRARIVYKICVLTYQTLNTGKPLYLYQLLRPFVLPTLIQVRHSLEFRLEEPRTRTHWGTRAFSSCAPRLYNSLPLDLRLSSNIAAFKSKLKTFIFSQCYDIETGTIVDLYRTN